MTNAIAPKIYGYARSSMADPDNVQQIEALRAAGATEDLIFSETERGRNFNGYAMFELLNTLKSGDVLIVTEMGRLGQLLSEVLTNLTKIHALGCHLKVLNINLDSRDQFDQRIFSILSTISQCGVELQLERRLEGARSARDNGPNWSPPNKVVSDEDVRFAIHQMNCDRSLKSSKLAAAMGITRQALDKRIKRIKERDNGLQRDRYHTAT